MNKIYTLLSVLLISSCQLLSLEPDFVTPETTYKTEDDVLAALTGTYNALMGRYNRLYNGPYYTHMSVSDEFYFTSYQPAQDIRIYSFDASDTEVQKMWAGLYQCISRANYLIHHVAKSGLDSEKVMAYVGEAKFLRAYSYFLLVTQFGSVPMPLEPTFSPDSRYFLPQSSIREIYAQIEKDMKEAEAVVLDITDLPTNERISVTGVQAVLARVYMSMAGQPLMETARYKDAAEYCEKVISSEMHDLNPDYKQIFINQIKNISEPKECIWEIAAHGNNLSGEVQAGQLGIVNGISCVSEEVGYSSGSIRTPIKLWNSFMGENDTRRDWCIASYYYKQKEGTLDVEKIDWPDTKIWERYPGKWRREYEEGVKAKSFNSTNFPVIRYADVLLMKAEAMNAIRKGPNYEAYLLVNQVRKRALGKDAAGYELPGELDYQQFLDAIKKERMVELCFEGIRKTDLLRWGDLIGNVREMGKGLKEYFPNNSYYLVGENISERNLFFPIPTAEYSMNKNIKQNNGW